MSYSMWFWRQEEGCTLFPFTVPASLCENEPIAGLVPIDIEGIKGQIASAFPTLLGNAFEVGDTWITIDEYPPYAFEINSPPPDDREIVEALNEVIEILNRNGCSLYDPQTDTRYSC